MDSISRQAAIDALNEYRALFCDNTPETFNRLPYHEKCRVDEIDNAIATLVNMPSAQPEIIRCKDCKHYLGSWYCEAWNNSPGFPAVDEDWYCYLAERLEE